MTIHSIVFPPRHQHLMLYALSSCTEAFLSATVTEPRNRYLSSVPLLSHHRRGSRQPRQQHDILFYRTYASTKSNWDKSHNNSNSDDDDGHQQSSNSQDLHAMYKEQMEDLQAEREALFGFTEEDRSSWSGAHNHQHSASFMDQVNAAREKLLEEGKEADDDDEGDASDSDDHERRIQSNNSSAVPSWQDENDNRAQLLRNVVKASSGSSPLPNDESPAPAERRNDIATPQFSHLSTVDQNGTLSPQMVDVGSKPITERMAVAQARVVFPEEAWLALTRSNPAAHTLTKDDESSNGNSIQCLDLVGPKGPIFETAKIAGIMAAKKTSDMIPLCHNIPLDRVNVNITLDESTQSAMIRCECRVSHKTGVEMEALTGASVAALTVYDMCKAVSHDICIQNIQLVQKMGGKRVVDKTTTSD